MAIVKWSPLKELEEMRRDMDRLFEEFFTPASRRRRTWPEKLDAGVIVPNIDLFDRKNEIVVRAELPGVTREDIDLTISKDSVTMKGELKRNQEVKDEDYYSREIVCGSFARTIALPAEVESENAKASFKDGILEVVLPKKEEAKPKEIKIEVK